MTTLMRAVNPGNYDRRCDSKCHFAQGPICDCLCGGRYHGAALQEGELEKRVEEFGAEVFEEAKRRWPEVVVGSGEEEDPDEGPKTTPTKAGSLWEIPAKRPRRW